MELIKDYNINILYHFGKANIMVGSSIRKAKSMGSLVCLEVTIHPLAKGIQTLPNNFM